MTCTCPYLWSSSKQNSLSKLHLLYYEGLRDANRGCDGVFHTASPVRFPDVPVSSLSFWI